MDISKLQISTNSNGKKVINGEYEIIRKIGEGQFGKVMLSRKINEDFVAIKTINRIDKTKLITKTYLNHTTKIKREIQIMKECKHPNVVKLYQVIDDLKYDKILLILEYCSLGEINWKLYNHYNERNKPKGEGLTLNKILRDVVNGLEYLHEYKGIIHRDLKPSNLLIAKDNSIKISDFGVSLILENNSNDSKELGKTMGTPAFYAPELCQFVNNRLSMINDASGNNSNNSIKIDKRIDIWSLGITLYCLIFNDLPFNGKNEFSLFKNIVKKDLKFPNKLKFKINESELCEFKLLTNLISKILIKDPNKRISLQDIKNHDFTIFDLNLKQSLEFKNFNNILIDKQLDFSSKIKKFFGGKPVSNVSPVKINNTQDPQKLIDLEPVDDLLDSYFNDSSEYEEEDPETVDNISVNYNDVKTPDSSEFNLISTGTKVNSETFNSNANIYSRHGSFSKFDEIDRSIRPPPLNLSSSPYSVSTSSPISLSSNVTVTIGPNSDSMYSPTRNFFDKIKSMDTNYTISSLANTNDDGNLKLEPPSIFRSRHNSSSSNKLMRITSSTSSLNLNAYLSDSVQESESESELESQDELENEAKHTLRNGDDENEMNDTRDCDSVDSEADSTFVLEPHNYNKFQDMSNYLDRLD